MKHGIVGSRADRFETVFVRSKISEAKEIAGNQVGATETDTERRQATSGHYRCS